MNRKTIKNASILICLMASPLAMSQVNENALNQGEALFKDKCARCHSKLIGRKITGSPKLKNLDAAYIKAKLTGYAEDDKDYTEEKKYKQKMIDTAKALSESDINNLAAFLSTK